MRGAHIREVLRSTIGDQLGEVSGPPQKGARPTFVRLLPMSVARNKAFALVALSLSQSPPARSLCCVVHLEDVRVSRVFCVYVGWGYYVPSPVR